MTPSTKCCDKCHGYYVGLGEKREYWPLCSNKDCSCHSPSDAAVQELENSPQKKVMDYALNQMKDNLELSSKIPYHQVDHFHCWQQFQDHGFAACGIPLEKHTQCCLCDMKPPPTESWAESKDEKELNEAIKVLASIATKNYITPEMQMTASMYIEAKQAIDRSNYIESLKQRIQKLLSERESYQKELVARVTEKPTPDYPIEDAENPRLVALQEGARLGYAEARRDFLAIIRSLN